MEVLGDFRGEVEFAERGWPGIGIVVDVERAVIRDGRFGGGWLECALGSLSADELDVEAADDVDIRSALESRIYHYCVPSISSRVAT